MGHGLHFNLISSDRTNANTEPGLTLLFVDEVSGTEFHISKMERTLSIWIEILNGTLIAKACQRLWRICCYSVALDFRLCISRHQKFIEAAADSDSWFPHIPIDLFEEWPKHYFNSNTLMSMVIICWQDNVQLDFTGPKLCKEHMFLYMVKFISIDTAVKISALFVCLIILVIDSVQLINAIISRTKHTVCILLSTYYSLY